MRSTEDKRSYQHGPNQKTSSSNASTFEFHKGNGVVNYSTSGHRRQTALGKPTPSKWDDARKWIVGLPRGDKNQSKPRNSNADDRKLIASVPQQEQDYTSGEDEEGGEANGRPSPFTINQYEVETQKVDCDESIWRIHKPVQNTIASAVRSVCVRDMGTETTPIASQEPSRTATPIRATTPAAPIPISSGSSTAVRFQGTADQNYQTGLTLTESRGEASNSIANWSNATKQHGQESNGTALPENKDLGQAIKLNPLETRAMAWDEAERAKYMARYKREEVKIQAWENHEKWKAEMEMRKMEVKAERLKARAQEKLASKLATTKRIAEEKRANAEAKLNEKAVKTTEKADHIRRTGYLPSSFSFKLPSFCW